MEILKSMSKIGSLPILNRLSPDANQIPNREELGGYRKSQDLALKAAKEISSMLRVGWTEKQTANLMDEYLQDCGVDRFFHKSFVWFGERTKFDEVKHYNDYLPTARVLLEDEPFILDVAPILNGYISDIGYSDCKNDHAELDEAKLYLNDLKGRVPEMFKAENCWAQVDADIKKHGYDNIHATYPFGVLGHRVHKVEPNGVAAEVLNFGWQSYWAFLSRGLFGQLYNKHYAGDTNGLWAVEPHIASKTFGAKFEEILVVNGDDIQWLSELDL